MDMDMDMSMYCCTVESPAPCLGARSRPWLAPGPWCVCLSCVYCLRLHLACVCGVCVSTLCLYSSLSILPVPRVLLRPGVCLQLLVGSWRLARAPFVWGSARFAPAPHVLVYRYYFPVPDSPIHRVAIGHSRAPRTCQHAARPETGRPETCSKALRKAACGGRSCDSQRKVPQ